MGSETIPKTIICEHSLLLHPHMQVKTLPCKEETVYKQDPETPPPSLGPVASMMVWG